MKTCRKGLHTYEPVKGSHKGCPDCNALRTKNWAITNLEVNANYMKRYYKNNKTNHQIRMAKWRKENLAKQAIYTAERKARELRATPVWLTVDQLQDIRAYYNLAKELSWLSESPLEVDHIVPLQGKNVRGLHVPWNLQILPESMNCSKGNRC